MAAVRLLCMATVAAVDLTNLHHHQWAKHGGKKPDNQPSEPRLDAAGGPGSMPCTSCCDTATTCSIAGCNGSLDTGAAGTSKEWYQTFCPKTCGTCLPDYCWGASWPNVTNCVQWRTDKNYRYVMSNLVPPYHFEPYCPFGVGGNYCVPGNDNCPFSTDFLCPYNGTEQGWSGEDGTTKGDVVVPQQLNIFTYIRPDPTSDDKPKSMYGGSGPTVAVHLNGISMQGPEDAGGINVDIGGFSPLVCGGHVTPPVGAGPEYHYHKAPDCTINDTPNAHSELIGWAIDGFGVYGFKDMDGKAPVLDECSGHFGEVPGGGVVYHYHAVNVTNKKGTPFVPYYMGCQGPSKGLCKNNTDGQWCGEGCGAEVCVQPGTNRTALREYFAGFGSADWMHNFTVNEF